MAEELNHPPQRSYRVKLEYMMTLQTMMLQQIMDSGQQTDQMLDDHDTLLRNQQLAFLDLQRSVGEMSRRLEEERMDEEMEEDIEVDLTELPYPARALQQGREHGYGYFHERFEQFLPPDDDLQESQDGPESITDVSAPPPLPPTSPYKYWLDPDDGFWSDDEVERIEEVEEVECLAVDEVARGPAWEDEFGEELIGLPAPAEDTGDFDPIRDLFILESLIAGKPIIEVEEDEVVEEEENHCRPEVQKEDTPPQREKAKKKKPKDRDRLRVRVWTRLKKKEPMKPNPSSHYIPRIRLDPGRYKSRWSDPLVDFRSPFNSTDLFFIYRVELNGLDRGWIKEKPPDSAMSEGRALT